MTLEERAKDFIKRVHGSFIKKMKEATASNVKAGATCGARLPRWRDTNKKVKELRLRLERVNPEAEVQVIAYNRSVPFSIVYGTSEGCDEGNCETWGFYLDAFNGAELAAPKEGT